MKSKLKIKYILVLVIFFVLSLVISVPYRSYIYKNAYYDFGVADVGYNIFAVPVISLFSWLGFFNFSKNKFIDILLFTGIYLILEIASSYFPIFGVFDIKDIMALLFSGLIAMVLLYAFDKNSIQTFFNRFKGL